jgi:chromosome partitioning protein
MTPVIALINRKGGVGKTTLAVHLAAGMAARGLRVGLIDTDSQGHCALMLDMPEENGLHAALVDKASLNEVVRQVPPEHYTPAPHPDGALLLLPGAEKTHRISADIDESDVFAFISLTDELAAAGRLDAIIVDTNPTLNRLDSIVWMAVDNHLYVVECERMAFDGLEKALGQARRFSAQRRSYIQRDTAVLGIIPNKLRANTELHRNNIAHLKKRYGELVWDPITLRVDWPSATNLRRTIYLTAPNSVPNSDAWAMVDRAISALGLAVPT